MSIVGEASVKAGAPLDLRPVVLPIVTGLPPHSLTYLLFGRLPEGATFDAATGKIGGRVLETGSHRVWVSATDSTGATVTAGVTIVVT
ncbi:Ig domain-containing protein [Agrobacterium sp. CCNWLW71]|uniref:Ig domain-containing protein n=1 Tax=unclassified Agrobacterium TaxID=2632611 RepID=UPI002FF0199D